MRLFRDVIVVCIVLVAGAGVSAAAVRYSITDLGAFGGVSSFVNSINDGGQVVGWYETADGSRYAFLYDHGVSTELGTLGGNYTVTKSINNHGQIVGVSYAGTNHGFIFENGVMRDLAPNGPILYPNAINDDGQIAGYTSTPRAVLFSNGTAIDLGTPSGYLSFAQGINNRGQVVGNYDRPRVGGAETRAFLYSAGKLIDIGTLYGNAFLEVPFTSAESINEQGQIVGRGTTASEDTHAFLYSGGVMRDLGTLGARASTAYSINNVGDIVGEFVNTPIDRRAFIYRDGLITDLNDLIEPGSGWTVQWARDINDFGQIAAVGLNDGASHALLLTPVPEPAAWVAALLMWASMSRRRRPG
jgi:probable HAF family extracellular repeat protein